MTYQTYTTISAKNKQQLAIRIIHMQNCGWVVFVPTSENGATGVFHTVMVRDASHMPYIGLAGLLGFLACYGYIIWEYML